MKFTKTLLATLSLLALAACNDGNQSIFATKSSLNEENIAKWPPIEGSLQFDIAENVFQDNLVIIYDTSGSMNDPVKNSCNGEDRNSKHYVGVSAVNKFLDTVPDNMSIGLVTFSNSYRVDLSEKTKSLIEAELANITPSGNTPLGSAIGEAYEQLKLKALSQSGYGTYRILILTDGDASDSETLRHNVDYIVNNTPVEIFTAGFCISDNHVLNNEGSTEFKNAKNIEELLDGMKAVLAESSGFSDTATFN